MRIANISRKTFETDINIELNLDGSGESEINIGCGFLEHMLTLFAKHGRFDLKVSCVGDTHVDFHHSAEDIGISLGLAFNNALGDKRGILRYGSMLIPMDETLILSAVDISGRGFLVYNLNIPTEKVGDFDTELCEEFWISFARNANLTLHILQLEGKNSHHIIEGCFKSVGRSLRSAVSVDPKFINDIPSTKGVI